MQGSNLEAEGRCSCGRWLAAAASYSYRSGTDRYLFHRCDCGHEWTEHESHIDLTEPVSSDEVIAVHVRMANFDGPIGDLLHHSP
jgi:hypothetical protein